MTAEVVTHILLGILVLLATEKTRADSLSQDDYTVVVNYQETDEDDLLIFTVESDVDKLEGYKINLHLTDGEGAWKSYSEFLLTNRPTWVYEYTDSFIQPGQSLKFTISLRVNGEWLSGYEQEAIIPEESSRLVTQESVNTEANTETTTATTTTSKATHQPRNRFRSFKRQRPTPPPRPHSQGQELNPADFNLGINASAEYSACLQREILKGTSGDIGSCNIFLRSRPSSTNRPSSNPPIRTLRNTSPASTTTVNTPRTNTDDSPKTPATTPSSGSVSKPAHQTTERPPPRTTTKSPKYEKSIDVTVIIVSTVVPIIVMVGIILIVLIIIKYRSNRSPPGGYQPPPTFSNANYHSRATLEAQGRPQVQLNRTDMMSPTDEPQYNYIGEGELYEEIPAGEDNFSKPQPVSDWGSENYEDPTENLNHNPAQTWGDENYEDPTASPSHNPPHTWGDTEANYQDPTTNPAHNPTPYSEYIDPEVGLQIQPPFTRTLERPPYERPLPQQPGTTGGRTYTTLNREYSDAYEP